MNQPYLECGMCGRSNDAPCTECSSALEEEYEYQEMKIKKMFIGSGEDAEIFCNTEISLEALCQQ